MNWASPLDVIVNVIAAAACLGFLVFVIVYAVFSNWRATTAGRALMYAVGSLDLLVLTNSVHLFTGPYPGIEFVRIAVYSTLCLASWRLVWTLIAILRAGNSITVGSFVEPKTSQEERMTSPIPTPTTQTTHPWRAALRTGGAIAVSLLLALAAIGPLVVEFVEKQFPGSPAGVIVASAAGFIAGLAVLVNRIMLLAPVTALLTRIGLGPAPK